MEEIRDNRRIPMAFRDGFNAYYDGHGSQFTGWTHDLWVMGYDLARKMELHEAGHILGITSDGVAVLKPHTRSKKFTKKQVMAAVKIAVNNL